VGPPSQQAEYLLLYFSHRNWDFGMFGTKDTGPYMMRNFYDLDTY